MVDTQMSAWYNRPILSFTQLFYAIVQAKVSKIAKNGLLKVRQKIHKSGGKDHEQKPEVRYLGGFVPDAGCNHVRWLRQGEAC